MLVGTLTEDETLRRGLKSSDNRGCVQKERGSDLKPKWVSKRIFCRSIMSSSSLRLEETSLIFAPDGQKFQ